MSRKRKNAGEGYGYMFSGAFKKKSDAAKKERTRKGSFVKGVYTPQGHRYVVMTPRTNPRRTNATSDKYPRMAITTADGYRAEEISRSRFRVLTPHGDHSATLTSRRKAQQWINEDRDRRTKNPTELLVMGANPHERELTVPPGTTITIRTNPVNPGGLFTSAHARAAGIARPLGWTPQQKRYAKALRKASGSEGARLMRSYRKREKPPRGASKVFHELYGPNPAICGHMIGGLPCTRKPGHKGPHLPQGATLRPRSRHGWNPSAVALREEFTGAESKWVNIYDEPHMPRGDYAQLGELLALYVKPLSGGQVQQITFPKSARPRLVSDETARQIYFVAGDQDVRASLSHFSARERGSGLFELGEARRIDYKQRKEHVPDSEVDEWRHEFGEESGVRPTLLYDANKNRLLLEGGEYVIRAEGIVN